VALKGTSIKEGEKVKTRSTIDRLLSDRQTLLWMLFGTVFLAGCFYALAPQNIIESQPSRASLQHIGKG
jgi:hypothetical protein